MIAYGQFMSNWGLFQKLSNKISILCEHIMEEAETLPNVTITDPLLLPNDGDQNHSILGRAESR